MEEAALGPALMAGEFEQALLNLKSGKADGVDEVPAELLKALGTRKKRIV